MDNKSLVLILLMLALINGTINYAGHRVEKELQKTNRLLQKLGEING